MIISRTPYRISLFGGGTDYPEWYRERGGAVLATTIDKYCYLTCRYLPPFFDYKYRVVWSKLECQQRIEEIQHPVVACLLKYLGIDRGVDVHHVGDLPARSGMGSSSSFTVGLIHALYALQGRMVGKSRLMHEAIHVEQDLLGEVVGSQDQVSAAVGGFNKITFARSGHIQATPILLPAARVEDLDDHLMLFYTGIARTAAEIATTYVTDLQSKHRQLRTMKFMVDESVELLTSGASIVDFGELIDEAWQLKRGLGSSISNSEIDRVYDRALEAGAIGGKLTGAGGGGFLLLCVPPAKQQSVAAALADLVHVPFRFEASGSQIIFSDPEEDFARVEAEREGRPIRAFREADELANEVTLPTVPIPYPMVRDTQEVGDVH